jgi:hypothetical protein
MHERTNERVERLRQEIRDQRVAVGDRLDVIARRVRGQIDVGGRAREAIAANPLPALTGGLALGFLLGYSAPDLVAGLARAAWRGTRVAVRLGGPAAIFLLAAEERARLRALPARPARARLGPPLEGGHIRRSGAPSALGA